MNRAQRIVLALVAAAAALMLVYPPFYTQLPNGLVDNLGYGYILDPPELGRLHGVVNAATLLVQLIGLSIVGALMWLLAAGVRFHRPKKAPPPGTFNPAVAAEIMAQQRRKTENRSPDDTSVPRGLTQPSTTPPSKTSLTRTQRLLSVAKKVNARRKHEGKAQSSSAPTAAKRNP